MGAFSRADLDTKVGELYDRLEELHAIDAILDEVEAQDLTRLNYNGNAYDGSLAERNTSIQLGVTYPFTLRVRAQNSTTTQGYPYSSPPVTTHEDIDFGFVEDAYPAAAEWRELVEGRFYQIADPLLRVDAASFEQVSYALVDLYTTLHTSVRDDWSGLADQSSEWEGEGALAFFTNFETPMRGIIDSHKWAIDYVHTLVCGLKACNDAGQLSLLKIVEGAAEIADLQLRKRQEMSRSSDSAGALVLGSTVLGILAAVSFPVPGAAAALGSASYLLNYASTQVPPANDELRTMEAHSAPSLDNQVYAEIYELKGNVRNALDEADHRVADMRDAVEALEAGDVPGSPVNAWIPIRPDVAPGDDFYHESRNY